MNTWDQRFLALAEHIAAWSKDPRTKVGAVIVDTDRRVVSVGYNGFAKRVNDDPERYEDRDVKLKMIIHAERNAILFANRSLELCTLYTWPMMPCAPCAAMVIQSGIQRVVAPKAETEHWAEDFKLSQQMFFEAGIDLFLT